MILFGLIVNFGSVRVLNNVCISLVVDNGCIVCILFLFWLVLIRLISVCFIFVISFCFVMKDF